MNSRNRSARPARGWGVLAAADHEPSTAADIARAPGLTAQSVQRVADLFESAKIEWANALANALSVADVTRASTTLEQRVNLLGS